MKNFLLDLRRWAKRVPVLKNSVVYARIFGNKYGFFKKVRSLRAFLRDYAAYEALPANPLFTLESSNLYPCIYDKTAITPVEPVYFYQNAWCAGKIFQHKPARHVDVGSHIPAMGIISQFVPVTLVDIRPIAINLSGLTFVEGSILALPFADNSVESLSSICVIEHIGLGRYGDPLDAFGSEKAFLELRRILAYGGFFYISVPVDDASRVYFNAHRAFTRSLVLELAKGLELVEERYIYGNDLVENYRSNGGFGTGLYCFKKV